ncbi:MAG TPA: hypothetical protein VK178_15140 [Opitutaceae bacterium]|nr:hypothetical protein [Opitutaceae bacterium]
MKALSLLLCGCAVAAFSDVALHAAPRDHATRTGRLVEERDGFRVEYSAGLEPYVEAVYAELPAWRAKLREGENRFLAAGDPVVLVGSAKDLVSHRDEILRIAATEIGLPAPTALQGRVYDTMLGHYELMEWLQDLAPVGMFALARCDEVQIWQKDELARRLESGEPLDGFTWDPQTKEGNYEIKPPEYRRDGDQKAAAEKSDQVRLDHSFNYKPGADGVVDLVASFTFSSDGGPQPLQPAERTFRLEEVGPAARAYFLAVKPSSWPIVLSEKNAAESPKEVAEKCFSVLDGILGLGKPGASRNPAVLHTILHEVVEAGLVENYIGSADRRWLCDGVANYVAWKIVRDRCGPEVAQQSYDLDGQLARYAPLQPEIDLRRWRAVEATKEEERETPRTKAHYAFATRAVSELARRHGEDFLPKLFAEVTKTPRAKVRMSTVEKAYRKITGKKLGEVIKFAETAPVAAMAK